MSWHIAMVAAVVAGGSHANPKAVPVPAGAAEERATAPPARRTVREVSAP